MKGFLGAFIVFVFWASGGIYYISTTTPLSSSKLENTIANKEASTSLTIAQPAVNEIIKDDRPKEHFDKSDTENTSFTQDSLFAQGATSSSSQLLAEELKMSITISDTIDINEGEPEITFEQELQEEEEISNNKLFYPRYTKSSELILDQKLVDYANELKVILKEAPETKVTIIGHTDNVGSAKDNFSIGLKKSRQVKWYLTARKGLPRSRITATSRGEQEPIERNTSTWGRKQNNRIEIIVE